MADVIVHIGLHKTATTVLQKQFFPACPGLNYIARPTLGDFVHSVTTTDPIYFDGISERNSLQAVLRDDRPNLVSREALSGILHSGFTHHGLDHRSPILANLKAAIPNARIVLVIRRQDGLARSLYRQYLKVGGTDRIEKFYGLGGNVKPVVSLNVFRYGPYVDEVATLFEGRFLLLAMEEFIEHRERFLSKLAEFIGVELPRVELRHMNRTTFGPLALEASRYCNYLFRSRLNPRGVIPGVPVMKRGRVKWVSPMQFLHRSWPWKGRLRAADRLFRVGESILDQVKDDNRSLDARYRIGLEAYDYY